METTKSAIRYAIYARKSLESEDRQVQSIEDQLSRLHEIASQRSLIVVKTLTEARSAKNPNSRPVFEQLLSGIETGEFQGILCWQINRLSRNPIDSGRLSWLLQRGVLRSIHSVEREYRPEDNVLLLSVETGMANQFILDLSRNVRRGILGKLSRGELPGRAPAGYVNDRVAKVVVKDPERFLLLQKAWDLMLSGSYSVAAVRQKLNDQGFRHLQSGKPIALSSMYAIFANPFYAGMIRVNGQLYPGKHEAMISLDDFEKMQRLLPSSHRSRPSVHRFTYSRLLRCGDCGCMVTAEHKTKRLSNGEQRTYTYYHCTRKRPAADCRQKGCVREEVLTASIAAALGGVAIGDDFRAYALFNLTVDRQRRSARLASKSAEYEKARQNLEQRRSRLVDLCVRGAISEEDLASHRRTIDDERQALELQFQSQQQEALRTRRVEEAFNLLARIDERFLQGTAEERRKVLAGVGSNWTLEGGKPVVIMQTWCLRIAEAAKRFTKAIQRLEPGQTLARAMQNGAFTPLDSVWWALVDEVGNSLPEEKEKPCLCFRCFKRNSHRCPEECLPQKAA